MDTSRGEFELIGKFAARARQATSSTSGRVVRGIGDDAAVTLGEGVAVTSVDMFVEGVHFRREHSAPSQIGRKALSAGLSDLAAMGAAPGEAYVATGIPAGLAETECLELYSGLAEVADATGTQLAGGDISIAPVLVVAVTVVGYAESPDRLVDRAGARPGHVLGVTGELGGAAAGLMLLDKPDLSQRLDGAVTDALVARQLDPTPRLAAGAALADAGAAAMIDLSDGLGGDAGHLAAAAPAWLRLDLERLPLQAGVVEVAAAAGIDPLDLATSGGEDYELLVAIPPERFSEAAAAVERAGTRLTRIGEVSSGEGVELRGPGGDTRPARGFDHLGGR